MLAGKWIIATIASLAGSAVLLTARAADVATVAAAPAGIESSLSAAPDTAANPPGMAAPRDGTTDALSVRESADSARKSPYARASESGLRLNINTGDKRPHLEYRFDANTSMRLRANRDGVRLVTSWNF